MYTLFSVDDHIVEPSNTWSTRVPAKYRDRAPHVVEEGRRQVWVWDGGRELTMGLNAVAGKPKSAWGTDPTRFDEMIPGCFDPHERARDLLSNGILASVAFPTLPGFAGRKFQTFPDKDLALACVQAYNDFLLEEWCASRPDMFVPMTIAPVWNIELALSETTRCLERGTKALCWMEDPSNLGLPGYHTDYWEPLFALVQEADIPICMHVGGSAAASEIEGFPMVDIAASFTDAARAAINLMVSHLPRKYPKVKLVWSEGGIGWIPAAIERADRQWERHQYWTRVPYPDVLPSEVARRNMWFCMIEEPVGLKFRHEFDVERILWECDYPHADTTFPDSQAVAGALFDGLPPEEVRQITHANAEALFDFRLSADLLAECAEA